MSRSFKFISPKSSVSALSVALCCLASVSVKAQESGVVARQEVSSERLKAMSGTQLSIETATALGLTAGYCGSATAGAAGFGVISLYPLGPAISVGGIYLAHIVEKRGMGYGEGPEARQSVTGQFMDSLATRPKDIAKDGFSTAGVFAGGVLSSVYSVGHFLTTGSADGFRMMQGALIVPYAVVQAFMTHPDSGCRQSFTRLWNAVVEMRSRATPEQVRQADAQAESLTRDLLATP